MDRVEVIELILTVIIFLILLGLGVWAINFLYDVSTMIQHILG